MTQSDHDDDAEWRQASRAAASYFESVGIEADCEWFEFVGEGLSYAAFVSDIEVEGEWAGEIVVRLPAEDVEPGQPERAQLEKVVRQWLHGKEADLGFRVPRVFHLADAKYGVALVEEYAYGDPLDAVDPLRWGSASITAEIAAALHSVSLDDAPTNLPGVKTRRDHALEWAAVIEKGEDPVFADARSWVEDHLPPDDEPAVLLHGDLLGQNIIVEIDDDFAEILERWLVDWEAVYVGDPAYDLAIVTRAYRKPLGMPTRDFVGLYNGLAARPVDLSHVRIFELGLRASWYLEVIEDEGDTPHARQRLQDFRALFRRAHRS